MLEAPPLSAGDRVVQLLRGLGVERAHFVQGFAEAAAHPEVVASLALVTPSAGAAPPLQRLAASRALTVSPLIVYGDEGPLARAAPFVLAAHPGAKAVALRGFAAAMWTDTIAERTDEVAAALLAHFADADRTAALPPLRLEQPEGEFAGVTYRARGQGAPVLLFPLGLAPSQWDPILPALAERYCVLTLGGPHLGFVAALEQRALGGYGAVVDTLIDGLRLQAGASVLEVGCGSGALTRRLTSRVGPTGRVVGVDINAFLRREAIALANAADLAEHIDFRPGSATDLPFPDATFDAALASTVLDEVDTDRGLTELARVVRPGGRVAVLVRADDLPTWDSLPLPPEIRSKVDARPRAGATHGACADGTLYRRFLAHGFTDVTMGPQHAVDRPTPAQPDWQTWYQSACLSVLTESESSQWRHLAAQCTAEGHFLWSFPYHCAVGTRP